MGFLWDNLKYGSIGPRGVTRTVLQEKEGLDFSVLFVVSGILLKLSFPGTNQDYWIFAAAFKKVGKIL